MPKAPNCPNEANIGGIPMLKLYFQIRKFYKIFGSELGINPISKLSEMTADNLRDVQYDINEALEAVSDCTHPEAQSLKAWLIKLHQNITHKPSLLSTILATIGVLLLLWCTISTFEVISKNTDPNPKYTPTNIWVMLFEET